MRFNLPLTLLRLCKVAFAAIRLPLAKLDFWRNAETPDINEMYSHFTKPHPRYKLIRNKSVGIALIDLNNFVNPDEYLSSVSKKDQGAHHSKRAERRGFIFREIDQNEYIDDIHAINISISKRQGRPMDAAYSNKPLNYERKPHFRYFGVVDINGMLVAYCNIAIYGNFAATDRLLGYKNNDGTMYLLLVKIICQLIDDTQVQYFMYDTFLGAQEGLRNFKRRLGFLPYRIRYTMR